MVLTRILQGSRARTKKDVDAAIGKDVGILVRDRKSGVILQSS